MNFMNHLKSQTNKQMTLTENGALAYETSGHALLDMLFAISALRGASLREIENMFSDSFYENPHDAVKFLFWVRDCREGAGERRIFRENLIWLTENRPEIVKATLDLIPVYGRWDDLWVLLDTPLKDDVINLVRQTLTADREAMKKGKPISLLAKWTPSSNASSLHTSYYANIIMSGLDMDPRKYRKMLSEMRSYLDVVERKMSANEWGDINYETVPSKANLIYKDAFLRHDEARRKAYLDAIQSGEAKINAGVLQPHEIVNSYIRAFNYYFGSEMKSYDETLEELWKALPDVTIDDTLVVEDTSGSMCGAYGTKVRPIDVATALAIYLSEHNGEEWKDKIISFSATPKYIDLSRCKSLREKIGYILDHAEVSNTDIERTMQLILDTAIANNLTQEEMPGTVLILSDCQWDQMTYIRGKSPNASLFDNIAREFERHGYKLPKVIFWNLSGTVDRTIPMQENEMGVTLISGFSIQLMNMVMSGKTDPYEVLLETINASRYDAVEEALKGII